MALGLSYHTGSFFSWWIRPDSCPFLSYLSVFISPLRQEKFALHAKKYGFLAMTSLYRTH